MTTAPAERLVVRTTDFDETVAAMRATFGDVDLRRDEDGESDLSLHSVRTAGLAASRWRMTGIGGGSRDEDAIGEEAFLTGVSLGGGLRMWSRWTDIDCDRPFIYPDRIDSVLGRPDVANLAVSRAVVTARARATAGKDDLELRFTGTAPSDPATDGVWRDTMIYVARTMDALADVPDGSIAQAGLLDLVAGLVLCTFRNTATDAMSRDEPLRSVTPVLRRAVRYMDDHLAEPISVTDIAAAARLSTRGLYAAFRRDMDTTPTEYLRAARAAAARQELLAADPGVTTVTAVALRWGFTHVGRFADRYRTAFGESPTDTLRR
jgi:AraC-like DNA-binding protein